jgi:acyl carrier protein
MTHDEIQRVTLEVLQTIAPDADLAAIEPATSFRDQFEIDSVDYLNFVLALEQRLGIRIPELDYPRLSSLQGCVLYLEGRAGR